MPEALTYSDARKNLASTMDKVCDTHDPVIITRRKAKPVVMMSLEDYNSIAETAYLLHSPANAARLRESIQAAEAKKTTAHTLLEA
ncbi:type II toxin-antitoxin system Phd/YefM family antitoxin [Desulfovibrio psychrotolerans]|uniref:Antitoxin n=1 Tax=Desulfovibrio psychrotolerans TaxID=415242 RepID=A0A7J0BPH0_9BACT|nr:type II toxin-antitoxin system prevent-host-death family antitoxin [Desulfovibrio psychrotolerans]GFM35597.1 antitoxin [Desulfovibrio psychrotolerans]